MSEVCAGQRAVGTRPCNVLGAHQARGRGGVGARSIDWARDESHPGGGRPRDSNSLGRREE